MPFTSQSIFQNQGCFVFVSGSKTSFNSPTERNEINGEEAVTVRSGRGIAHEDQATLSAWRICPFGDPVIVDYKTIARINHLTKK